jgi:hypothetical protein
MSDAPAHRCPRCRKTFNVRKSDFEMHANMKRCSGPDPGGDDGIHRVGVAAGEGIYCWACGRARRTLWADPDFCCATCKAVLLTIGDLNE